MGDNELLHRFQSERSEPAFTALVRRYGPQVYSSAIRQVGSHDLAQEVSQAVFLELAKQCARLGPGTHLAAWLQVVTRRRAIDLIRKETRRRRLEAAAASDPTLTSTQGEGTSWNEIGSVLDAALCELSEVDREALLRRFFDDQSFKTIGTALRTSEDTAQKRVARALDRLRAQLLKRGVTTASGMALGSAISMYGRTMPPDWVDQFATTTAHSARLGLRPSSSLTGLRRLNPHLIAAAAVTASAVALFQLRTHAQLGLELSHLRSEVGRLDRQMMAPSQTPSAAQTLANPAVGAATISDLEPEAAVLSERIRTAKKWFVARPSQFSAQMKLLTNEDWVLIIDQFPRLDGLQGKSPQDWDRALNDVAVSLDQQATQVFKPLLDHAWHEYQAAWGGRVPTKLTELEPFFGAGFDPHILDTYNLSGSQLTAHHDSTFKGGINIWEVDP